MINLYVQRYEYQDERTFGELFVNGVYVCDTLEDRYRDIEVEGKVSGATCIPSGRYNCIIAYSPKFKHRLPLLLNVKHFTGIRIHAGNTEDDTAGCILVGKRDNNKLIDSKLAIERLMKMLVNDTDIIITIHNKL